VFNRDRCTAPHSGARARTPSLAGGLSLRLTRPPPSAQTLPARTQLDACTTGGLLDAIIGTLLSGKDDAASAFPPAKCPPRSLTACDAPPGAPSWLRRRVAEADDEAELDAELAAASLATGAAALGAERARVRELNAALRTALAAAAAARAEAAAARQAAATAESALASRAQGGMQQLLDSAARLAVLALLLAILAALLRK
jgi:hypothetical protein